MTASRRHYFGYPLCMSLPISQARTLAGLSLLALFWAGCGSSPEPGDDDDSTVASDDDDSTEAVPLEFPLQLEVLVTVEGKPQAEISVLEGGGEVQAQTDEQGLATVVLQGIVADEVWVIAAAEGYRSVGVRIETAPLEPVELALLPVQVDNGDYQFLPAGVEEGESTAWCSHCHITIAEQFGGSAHYQSARDPQVHDLFAGTAAAFADPGACAEAGGRWLLGTAPGGAGDAERCYIGDGLLPDASTSCGESSQLPCDSPDLPAAEQPSVTGACADCHAPAVNEPLGGGHSLLEVSGQAWEEGVTCDFCHKVASIDINAEPGVGGRTVLGRPLEPAQGFPIPWKPVMYGPYADVINPYMGGSISPIFETGELCAGCHEYRQSPLWQATETAIDTSRWPDGTLPIHSTWQEWSTSLLAPATPCRVCHMPEAPALNSADIDLLGLDPGIVGGFHRPQGAVRDHGFYGATDILPDGSRLLDTAASMSLQASIEGAELVVSASVSNNQTGHGLPTGEPLRNLVLVVIARCDGAPLPQSSGQTITEVGGALASRQVGGDEVISGNTLSWADLPEGLDPSQLVLRAVRDTGAFLDYSGFESFGDGTFSAEQKGLPERLPLGETPVTSITDEQLVLAETLPLQAGDLLFLGEVLTLPEQGQPSLLLAGAAGADFARVLADAQGTTMVPHFRANDVVRDNRLLPYHSASSAHRFALPGTCSEVSAEARLVYRRYPPGLARERGWPSVDHVLASRELLVE